MRTYLIVVLISISLMASDAEHPFICLRALSLSSLEKCQFSFFAHFLIGLFVFLEWSCVSSVYILEIKTLSELSLSHIFSHRVGSLFILLVFSLHSGMLCSGKKEEALTFCNSVDGTGEHCAE